MLVSPPKEDPVPKWGEWLGWRAYRGLNHGSERWHQMARPAGRRPTRFPSHTLTRSPHPHLSLSVAWKVVPHFDFWTRFARSEPSGLSPCTCSNFLVCSQLRTSLCLLFLLGLQLPSFGHVCALNGVWTVLFLFLPASLLPFPFPLACFPCCVRWLVHFIEELCTGKSPPGVPCGEQTAPSSGATREFGAQHSRQANHQ